MKKSGPEWATEIQQFTVPLMTIDSSIVGGSDLSFYLRPSTKLLLEVEMQMFQITFNAELGGKSIADLTTGTKILQKRVQASQI